ncbi:guanine nucleotide-binding protein-like 3 [Histomonas meleagridis]|uniref:guanine nucleotide-binding protein-like 3 n=1 Tax=Histomonas meleagridis TaxID=135588 RepID=UPI003559F822|nr:guanine nucleotide-binding protein-like 3 [Histomonas meleagridis]KAH0800305.1 guanine nucleotide-binding protein-like 3 [Histomonas meleagridis]
MAAVIRKKAKAKRERERKEAKTKKFPKRSKKILNPPQSLPNREAIAAQVHEGSAFLNDVIRQVESTRVKEKRKPFEIQLENVKKQLAQAHKQKIQNATNSYQQLLAAVEEADTIIEVLDARDPTACRLLEAETEVLQNKKKPLIIILNKIDLIPREAAIRWLAKLIEVAPTVAISAINTQLSLPAVRDIIAQVAPNAQKVGVIGIRGVGKSTICQFNSGLLLEVESYSFLVPTPEMGLLQGADFVDPIHELATETFLRRNDDNIFLTLEIPPVEDPKEFFRAYGQKYGTNIRNAAKLIMDELWNGRYKYFTVPPDANLTNIMQSQQVALEASLPLELSGQEYIHLNEGNPLAIDEELLGEIMEEEEEDDEENPETNE